MWLIELIDQLTVQLAILQLELNHRRFTFGTALSHFELTRIHAISDVIYLIIFFADFFFKIQT